MIRNCFSLFCFTLIIGATSSDLLVTPLEASPWQDSASPSEQVMPNDDVDSGASSAATAVRRDGINFFNLLTRGGLFMIPLGLLSVMVITIAIERFIALRRDRILPRGLITELGQLSEAQGGFEPRQAYQVCQAYPSATSRILRSMLMKVGRPQSEVENAVSEASQREANRLNVVVSWLNLAAAVAPLIGLLGTVWGITQGFYEFTQVGDEQNRGAELAQGIYTALVTTMCGLTIAIPSAVLAHFFENRIVNLFNEIDELSFSLMPQIERYEGRVRFNQSEGNSTATPPPRGRGESESADETTATPR